VLLIGLGTIFSILSLMFGVAGRVAPIGWCVSGAALSLALGIVCLGGVYAIETQRGLAQILGREPSAADAVLERDTLDEETDESATPLRISDWSGAIAATGTQSRIGDALRCVLADHDASTLAGIVLLSDGQNNGGASMTAAISTATRSEVAVFPVGLCSS